MVGLPGFEPGVAGFFGDQLQQVIILTISKLILIPLEPAVLGLTTL